MAEKKAKTAEKSRGDVGYKHTCPSCGAESKVTMFAGHGRRGFFLVCDKNCGYVARTR
jgi:transcription elongation factor Elf1